MVYPVLDNTFKIATKGLASTEADMSTIADMESFSVAMDNGVEEWTPMSTNGWIRRLMTSKSMTITLSGKRNFGDKGNDYCAVLAFENGVDTYTKFAWIMADGTQIDFNCVVNVTTFGGDSTAVDALEIEILSDGQPTVTLAPPTPPETP